MNGTEDLCLDELESRIPGRALGVSEMEHRNHDDRGAILATATFLSHRLCH
jgi:hypothetical protein